MCWFPVITILIFHEIILLLDVKSSHGLVINHIVVSDFFWWWTTLECHQWLSSLNWIWSCLSFSTLCFMNHNFGLLKVLLVICHCSTNSKISRVGIWINRSRPGVLSGILTKSQASISYYVLYYIWWYGYNVSRIRFTSILLGLLHFNWRLTFLVGWKSWDMNLLWRHFLYLLDFFAIERLSSIRLLIRLWFLFDDFSFLTSVEELLLVSWSRFGSFTSSRVFGGTWMNCIRLTCINCLLSLLSLRTPLSLNLIILDLPWLTFNNPFDRALIPFVSLRFNGFWFIKLFHMGGKLLSLLNEIFQGREKE